MFIFSAAVIGTAPVADELADAIAAAGIAVVRDVDGLGGVELVLAVGPDADFDDLDARAPGHAILASADPEADVTELAELTTRPDLVVGFHPVGAKVVEIVHGEDTSDETGQAVAAFAQAIRRTPVHTPPGLTAGVRDAADPLAAACFMLEGGWGSIREIDTALALSGMKPGPFAAADQAGLDTLENPPRLVKRLVSQGRLGVAAGQGFYPYPRPDPGYEDALVKLETRDDIAIAWLASPPANSLSPDMVDALERAWTAADQTVHALVVASANPALFCAGADIKAFAAMDTADCKALLDRMHALLRSMGESRVATVAAVNGLALGGGCELAMACDVRLAAVSATFGQPEINLGIIPGFGGTQRLPQLVGQAKALEMNLTGDAISAESACEAGLANRVVADHELFDTALLWARKLAGKSPVAIQTIKQVSQHGTLEEGLAAEKQGFAAAFGSEDGKEGVLAFIEKRQPKWQGR
jgi:enoyl-CoA hydratase/3-hydroxyacyl-CoA dehydrogenase